MKKWMKLFAQIATLIVCLLLIVVFNYITTINITRTDEVILVEKEEYISFYSTTGRFLYDEGQQVEMQRSEGEPVDVTILKVTNINIPIGKENVIMYETDLTDFQNGTVATIYTKYDSFLEYIVDKMMQN